MGTHFRRIASGFILGLLAGSAQAADPPSGYARIERHGVNYHTLRAKPAQVSTRWLNKSGKPFRRMDVLKPALVAEGVDVLAIMNAGIYEPGGIPSGLHVENGVEQRPINLASKPGNFFLKPNGVFYITTDGRAGVMESHAFAKAAPPARLAIQSGPALLLDGKTHPKFNATSKNYLLRNGIGVIEATGEVLLVMTQLPQKRLANLHEFAEFFRAQGCANALFLDGDISEMHVPGVPELERVSTNELGAYLVITK